MPSDESTASRAPGGPGDPLERLSASARGWHTIQMAVLGFIGICGVLRSSSTSTPKAVQWIAAILAVAALAVACMAVFTVGRVAYPVNVTVQNGDTGQDVERGHRQLHTGIRLTVLALTLIVIAALSGWWPKTGTTNTSSVGLTDGNGQTWCGAMVSGPDGTVSIRTTEGIVSIPARTIVQLRPVTSCS
jgi:hypothetical protein